MNADQRNRRPWPFWLPLIAAVLISLLIRAYDLDRRISALCYDALNHRWPFERAEPGRSFYYFGRIPPALLALTGLLIAVWPDRLARFNPFSSRDEFRRRGLFLVLMFAIGPGLLIEAGLKSYWGRPRPIQCADFGGEMTFVPVGDWSDQNRINSSFPSGHAAAAFYFMSLGFVARPQDQRRLFLAGLGFGLAMGITRITQGGHFLSDVMWAGVIVYLVGVSLHRTILGQQSSRLVELNSAYGRIVPQAPSSIAN